MNRLITCFGILLSAQFAISQINVDWINPVAGTSSKYVGALAVDNSGNVYTTGYFFGTIDVDPGPSTQYMFATSVVTNVFVTKTDASGNLIWANEIATSNSCRSYDITVDNSGNVYVVGSKSLTKAAITKFNSLGVLQWSIELGSISTQNYIRTIQVDNSGDIIVGGQFNGTTDFDPGVGVTNMTPTSGVDGFICKYTSAGAFVWAKSIQGNGSQVVWDLKLDGSNAIYATGYYSGVTDFDPGASSYNLSNDSEDAFILNLNASGNFLWAKRITGLGNDRSHSISLDGNGDIYVAGYYNNDLQYDPGVNAIGVSSATNEDAYILKAQSNGTGIWMKSFGGSQNDRINSVAVNTAGDIYMTGVYEATVDFDPNSGTETNTSSGLSDGFISHFNTLGDLNWSAQFGGTGSENSRALQIGANNEVYVSGTFSGTVDFNPGSGVTNFSTVGGASDIFTVEYNPCASSSSAIIASTCDTYISPAGNIYTVSGNYVDTIPNIVGCDSLINIQLTVGTTPSVSLSATNASICEGDSTFLTAATSAPNVTWDNGLSSSLSHNVSPTNTTSYTVIADDGNGCADTSSFEVVVNHYPTLNLSLSDTTVCNGDSLYFSASGASTYYWDTPFGDTINPEWYTPLYDNMYYVYGTDSSGNCESLDSIFVQINTGPTTGAGSNGSNYMWVTDTSYSYQWYQDGNILTGEIDNEYIATQDGDYTVYVMDSLGCYITFSWTYSTANLSNIDEDDIRVYPNPFNSKVSISSDDNIFAIRLFDMIGNLVFSSPINSTESSIDLSSLSSGSYLMVLDLNKGSAKKMIIKH